MTTPREKAHAALDALLDATAARVEYIFGADDFLGPVYRRLNGNRHRAEDLLHVAITNFATHIQAEVEREREESA